jgi:hypothetical protein
MQLETGNIVKFLQTAYTDENLAALLAHAQDGKLSFSSCCCVAGIPSAGHALKGAGEYNHDHIPIHPMALRYPECELADAVSHEFMMLGEVGDGVTPPSDELRRERLMPLILAEQYRRAQSSTETLDSRELIEVA